MEGSLDSNWTDPEGVVSERRFVTADELKALRHKPDGLSTMAFSGQTVPYDPLEKLVR